MPRRITASIGLALTFGSLTAAQVRHRATFTVDIATAARGTNEIFWGLEPVAGKSV